MIRTLKKFETENEKENMFKNYPNGNKLRILDGLVNMFISADIKFVEFWYQYRFLSSSSKILLLIRPSNSSQYSCYLDDAAVFTKYFREITTTYEEIDDKYGGAALTIAKINQDELMKYAKVLVEKGYTIILNHSHSGNNHSNVFLVSVEQS